MSESLELDDVVQRFAESEQALAKAAEQIGRLESAEHRASQAAAALEATADGVRGFAHEASQAAASLAAAQEETQRVLQAGGRVLDGSDLREMRADLDKLQAAVASIVEATAAISSRLDALDQRIGDVETAKERAALLDRQLAHIRANVSDRHLRKALESLPQQ